MARIVAETHITPVLAELQMACEFDPKNWYGDFCLAA